ncbi:MAG: MlaD family protein, partial [Pirellulaceae bacterium]|nr:MlaD family protein [Pirellulaceae bacterium]
MSERIRNIIVGITMLLGIVGVAVMMLLFGYAPAWLDRGYSVTIQMNSASGLAVGSRVRMSGTDVGRVTSVRLAEPPNWGVVLEAMIKHDVRLPEGVRVSVESSILGGSPALTFEIPPQRDGAMLPTDGRGRIEVKHDVPTL